MSEQAPREQEPYEYASTETLDAFRADLMASRGITPDEAPVAEPKEVTGNVLDAGNSADLPETTETTGDGFDLETAEERYRVLREYVDSAHAVLDKVGGNRGKSALATVKAELETAGRDVSGLTWKTFFDSVQAADKERGKLGKAIAAERTKRSKPAQPTERSGSKVKTEKSESKPRPTKSTDRKPVAHVSQARLDENDTRTRVFNIDPDEGDEVANARAAVKAATTKPVTPPVAKSTPAAAETVSTEHKMSVEEKRKIRGIDADISNQELAKSVDDLLGDYLKVDDAGRVRHGVETEKVVVGDPKDGKSVEKNVYNRFEDSDKLYSIAAFADEIRGGMTEERKAEYEEYLRTKGTGEGEPTGRVEPGAPAPTEAPAPAAGQEKISFAETRTKTMEQLGEELMAARADYAVLTAKTRGNTYGRFLERDGKFSNFLKKIPGVKFIANLLNDTKGAEELTSAKNAYLNTLREQRLLIAREAMKAGLTEEEAREGLTIGLAKENETLECMIASGRMESSKKSSGFADLWMRLDSKGWKGKVAQGAIVFGGGIVIGAAVGSGLGAVFGAGIAGFAGTASSIAGAAGGVGAAKHITNRRANARISKDGPTIAQLESSQDLERKNAALEAAGTDIDAQFRSGVLETERSTTESVIGNRNRTRFMGGLAASGAVLGGNLLANVVGDAVHHAGSVNPAEAHPNEGQLPNKRYADVDKMHNGFNVESGSGFDRELVQWAHANHLPLDGHQADALTHALREHFGNGNIIDLDHVKKAAETYIQQGDLRINMPGHAHWRKGVAEFAKQWILTHPK